MPPEQLFKAANDFLLRQHDDESFATAVHLLVDLEEGGYQITSAGHPPALRWDLPSGEWVIDNARGTALGVLRDPELHSSQGRLFPGEALLFYTDGVVEARGAHIDVGIAWLQRVARDAIGGGFDGAADRIIGQVESGEDDRAVLILNRDRGAQPGDGAHARLSTARRSASRGHPRHDEGGQEGAERAEGHVAERVLVGGVQLGAVPDERVPLAELPAEREQAAEPGDEQRAAPTAARGPSR